MFIWFIPDFCSSLAAAISDMSCVTFLTELIISLIASPLLFAWILPFSIF
jgi:hypothetical protein